MHKQWSSLKKSKTSVVRYVTVPWCHTRDTRAYYWMVWRAFCACLSLFYKNKNSLFGFAAAAAVTVKAVKTVKAVDQGAATFRHFTFFQLFIPFFSRHSKSSFRLGLKRSTLVLKKIIAVQPGQLSEFRWRHRCCHNRAWGSTCRTSRSPHLHQHPGS